MGTRFWRCKCDTYKLDYTSGEENVCRGCGGLHVCGCVCGGGGLTNLLDALRYSIEFWNLWVTTWALCGNQALPADRSSDTAKLARYLQSLFTDRYMHPMIDDLLKRLRLARCKGASQVALRSGHKAAAPKGPIAAAAVATRARGKG